MSQKYGTPVVDLDSSTEQLHLSSSPNVSHITENEDKGEEVKIRPS
jgi:hypothetical protein